jgi:hypothetical protein
MESEMTTPEDTVRAADKPSTPARKTYQKPELHVYGDLATITQGLNRGGANDGTGHPNKHYTS